MTRRSVPVKQREPMMVADRVAYQIGQLPRLREDRADQRMRDMMALVFHIDQRPVGGGRQPQRLAVVGETASKQRNAAVVEQTERESPLR